MPLPLLFFVLSLSWNALSEPRKLVGRVIDIVDTETLMVADTTQGEHLVRMAGVVGTEPGHPTYKQAIKTLKTTLLNKTVTVEWERQEGNCDGRQIAARCRKYGKVFINTNSDVNLEQIALGLAKHDPAYRELQSTPDRTQYTEAEEKAREKKLGVWSEKKRPSKKKNAGNESF